MIQATQLHNTSTKSNHGPPELCMEIYTLPWKWINCEKTEGAAMGSPFPLLLVTSTWRDLKNKQSHHHLTYTGAAYWRVNTIPFALGQDFKYNIRPTNSWLPLCYSAITWIIEKAARHYKSWRLLEYSHYGKPCIFEAKSMWRCG